MMLARLSTQRSTPTNIRYTIMEPKVYDPGIRHLTDRLIGLVARRKRGHEPTHKKGTSAKRP